MDAALKAGEAPAEDAAAGATSAAPSLADVGAGGGGADDSDEDGVDTQEETDTPAAATTTEDDDNDSQQSDEAAAPAAGNHPFTIFPYFLHLIGHCSYPGRTPSCDSHQVSALLF